MSAVGSADRWSIREVSADLADRYVAAGFWDGRTLGQLVDGGLREMRDKTFAVHSEVRPWRGTMADVEGSARRFATWLVEHGIGPGDVVVMQLPNWSEAAVAFWGSALAGAVIVPVVHFYGAKELRYILDVAAPSMVISPDRFGNLDFTTWLPELVGDAGVPWLVVRNDPTAPVPEGATAFESALAGPELQVPIAVDPGRPAMVAFTSGTTRDPKGVIHTHNSIGFEVRQAATMSPSEGPNPITGAPVGHFIGLLSSLLGSIVRRIPVHFLDAWNPTRVLQLMRDEGIGLTGGATYFFSSLLDHPDLTPDDLACMKTAGLGGAPVPVPFAQRLTGLGIEVMRCYGSTEHPSITGCTFDEPRDKRLLTDGHALDGVELLLDEEGQILSRGPDLFVGYTDAELTATAFTDDGWYRTGDVGVLDADGYLAITDRISDVIIRGGENVSAQEIEELVLGLPGVAEVAVVAEPDERLGERAAAIVRILPGSTAPTLEEVKAHLAEVGLAKQKWPESLYAVTDLPRTPSGKIQKFKLRAQLRDGALESKVP